MFIAIIPRDLVTHGMAFWITCNVSVCEMRKKENVIKLSTWDHLNRMDGWYWLKVDIDVNCCSLLWEDVIWCDRKWRELGWNRTMACVSSLLKHRWIGECVERTHHNAAVALHPVWRIFTFRRPGCPTFGRQVLWLDVLDVNWRCVWGTKPGLALDAAHLILKLNKTKLLM